MRSIGFLIAILSSLLATGALGEAGAPDAVEPSAPDAFTWLEDAESAKARAWAAEQTAASMARLKGLPAFDGVERDIQAAQRKSSAPPSHYLLGNTIMRFARDRDRPLGVFAVAAVGKAGTGHWREVLDVAAYNKAHGVNYHVTFLDPAEQCLAPRFERCLIPFSDGGSSLLQYREFDLATGTFPRDGFATPPIRAGIAWIDADTLAVGHSLGDVPALQSGFPGAIYLWKRDTPIERSRPVFQANKDDSLISLTPLGNSRAGVLAISLARDYQTFEVSLMDRSGAVRPLDLPRGLQKFGAPAVVDGVFIFQLSGAASLEGTDFPADSVIAYDPLALPGRRVALVAAPAGGSYINDAYGGLTATRDGVVFVETRNLRKSVVLARRGNDGRWTRRTLMSADPGVAVTVQATGAERGVLVRQAGFLKPTEVGFLATDGRADPIYRAAPVIDASRYVSEIRTARSDDGTPVDYYLVRPKAAGAGPVPTIIGGYGGYGVNYDPNYFSGGLGTGLVPWLERGGAYALAAIRGGGERGSGWANAARGTRRQKSYDDFAAVARDLVGSGFTAPRRIGVFGRSFGGLLAANMAVQHPDLFGAALVGVPIVDLFRLGRGGKDISAGQKVEVGDWDDPRQAAIMRGYSPYQNIRSGVSYPRILTVVSTRDGQVGPGHGRKFTARLQSVGADAMLIEGPTGGHGFPDAFADPDEFAVQIAFFVDALMPGTR